MKNIVKSIMGGSSSSKKEKKTSSAKINDGSMNSRSSTGDRSRRHQQTDLCSSTNSATSSGGGGRRRSSDLSGSVNSAGGGRRSRMGSQNQKHRPSLEVMHPTDMIAMLERRASVVGSQDEAYNLFELMRSGNNCDLSEYCDDNESEFECKP